MERRPQRVEPRAQPRAAPAAPSLPGVDSSHHGRQCTRGDGSSAFERRNCPNRSTLTCLRDRFASRHACARTAGPRGRPEGARARSRRLARPWRRLFLPRRRLARVRQGLRPFVGHRRLQATVGCLFPARSDTVQPQRKAVPVPLDGRGRDALAGPGHGRLCAVEARPQPRPSPQHPRRPVLATHGAQQGREESARHGRAAAAGLAEQRNQGAPFRS